MTRVNRRALAAALSLVGVLVVTACGEEPEPRLEVADIATPRGEVAAENGLDKAKPEDALATVLDALSDSGAFHVSGSLRNGSTLDISYVVGIGATGTVSEPDSEAPVEIIAVDGRIYVTGDEDFLADSIGEDIDKTVAGKWLLLQEDSIEMYEVIADGERFAETVLGRGGVLEMTGVRELDGTPVIGLMFVDTGATLWAAASGEPVPILFEEKGATA
jgi:hypothetical protein